MGLLLALVTLPAWAGTHALLVGVGEVAALPKRLWLRGPANDVVLMRQVLLERGVPVIGVPVRAAAASDRTPSTAGPRSALERRLDGRTLLLAARAHEAATEEWLPRGAGLRQARMHGVFSLGTAVDGPPQPRSSTLARAWRGLAHSPHG